MFDYETFTVDQDEVTYQRAQAACHQGDYRRGDYDMSSYDDFGYLDYIELMS
jgi:hypothetical protein